MKRKLPSQKPKKDANQNKNKMSKINEFLNKIGVKTDVIEKLGSEEEVNLDDIVTSFKGSIREVIQNDPEFIQPIKDEIRGSELSKIEHKIKKQFGLSSEDVKDKNIDEIIATAYDKSRKSIASTTEEIQQKMMELSRENKRLLEEVLPAKEAETKEYVKQYRKETAMKSMLANKKDLLVKPEIAYLTLQDYLNKNYEVDIDETNNLLLKTKNGLNPLNADGTKIVSFDEVVDKKLQDDGLIVQSNAKAGTAPTQKVKTGQITEERKYNLPGIKTAEENAERMKNLRTFGQ